MNEGSSSRASNEADPVRRNIDGRTGCGAMGVDMTASVSANARRVHLLILGAGRGGRALLRVLHPYDGVVIDRIADIDPAAPAFADAASLGIAASSDVEAALAEFSGDIVLDVTGDPQLADRLRRHPALSGVEIISGKSAKMIFDLVLEQIRESHEIRLQSVRLDLLDALLETTRNPDTGREDDPLVHVTARSLDALHHHTSIRGIALLCHDRNDLEIVGAVGIPAPIFTNGLHARLAELVDRRDLPRLGTSRLEQPISVPGAELNTLLSVWHQEQRVALLLFELPGHPSSEQKAMLDLLSEHLTLAVANILWRRELEQMAFRDVLTGVYNRRHFLERMRVEISRTRRHPKAGLACAFIDLDELKRINDRFGHQGGDAAIAHIADAATQSVRDYDLVARYGGDEFVALMPIEEMAHASSVVEEIGVRMLERIRAGRVRGFPRLRCTASIGIAAQPAGELDGERLLQLADRAVYQAKRSGRNRLQTILPPVTASH